MPLLDRFRKKDQGTSPQAAAAQLDVYARQKLEEDRLPGLEQDYWNAVSTSFYFTKAAITIQWLRIMEHSSEGDLRPKAILEEFERLTFSPIPIEERLLLVEQIRSLIKVTLKLQECVEKQDLSREEITRQMLNISKEWFGLIFDDENLLRGLSIMHGADLLTAVHGEMAAIAKKVESALHGKVAE